jgi:tRNA G37 N-methylase TrmD
MRMKRKPLQVDIITIFPEMVEPYLAGAMLGRGQKAGALNLQTHHLR